MSFKGLPVMEFKINPKKKEDGVKLMSIVDKPAIQSNFYMFSEEEESQKYNFINEPKRMIAGLALIPDKKIYRNNKGQEFYGFFSKDTIEMIRNKFMKEKNTDVVNLEHQEDSHPKGVYLVESYIINSKNQQQDLYRMGIDAPLGSWFCQYHVESPKLFEQIKQAGFKGFSVEAFLDQELVELNENKNNVMSNLLNKFKTMLAEFEAELSQATVAETGQLVEIGQVGQAVMANATDPAGQTTQKPLADGVYKLEDGNTITIEKGLLATIQPPSTGETEMGDVSAAPTGGNDVAKAGDTTKSSIEIAPVKSIGEVATGKKKVKAVKMAEAKTTEPQSTKPPKGVSTSPQNQEYSLNGMALDFASYPFDKCLEDQSKAGYSKDAAAKICGAIKAQNASTDVPTAKFNGQDYAKNTPVADNPNGPTVPAPPLNAAPVEAPAGAPVGQKPTAKETGVPAGGETSKTSGTAPAQDNAKAPKGPNAMDVNAPNPEMPVVDENAPEGEDETVDPNIGSKTLGELIDLTKDGEYEICITVEGGKIVDADLNAMQELAKLAAQEKQTAVTALEAEITKLRAQLKLPITKPITDGTGEGQIKHFSKEELAKMTPYERHAVSIGARIIK